MANGLAPVSGSWTRAKAAHLLRRTLFGPTRDELEDATTSGLNATLNTLFGPRTSWGEPVNHFYQNSEVPVGTSWVNRSMSANFDVGVYRYPSLRGWYWNNLLHHDTNIMARMTMFWINHFGMGDVGEHRAEFQTIELFNSFGAGNFREMIERITVHPAMLRFLDGQSNNRWNPNENYARELFELFTIKIGPQNPNDQEDYTNYTEDDIRAAKFILTGWRNNGFWSSDVDEISSYFDANWHEPGPKTLSHRFNNAVIQENGADEYKDLIAVIFQQPETARAICRELYRFFVFSEIDATVESGVITPLANLLIAEDYELEPVLRNLFSSQHFYDMSVRGPVIKNPYEFIVSMARPLGGFAHLGLTLNGNAGLQTRYDLGTAHMWWAVQMEMDFLLPPTVSGWPAYYQSPAYYRSWVGSATLKRRKAIVDTYTGNGIYTRQDGNDNNYQPRPFDYLGFIDSLSSPYDVNEMILEITEIFLPRELHPDQVAALKNQLLPDLPDMEWARQYGDYQSSPNNPDVVNPLLAKVKAFFRAMFSLAEFNLM